MCLSAYLCVHPSMESIYRIHLPISIYLLTYIYCIFPTGEGSWVVLSATSARPEIRNCTDASSSHQQSSTRLWGKLSCVTGRLPEKHTVVPPAQVATQVLRRFLKIRKTLCCQQTCTNSSEFRSSLVLKVSDFFCPLIGDKQHNAAVLVAVTGSTRTSML